MKICLQIKEIFPFLLLLTLTFEHIPDDLGVEVDGLKACSTTDVELTDWLCLRTANKWVSMTL